MASIPTMLQNSDSLVISPIQPIRNLFGRWNFTGVESNRPALPSELEDTGLDFVDQLLDRFNVSYYVSQKSRRNIPAHGRVIVVANYPVSHLDSLALLRLVSEIRQDVKLVSMDLLTDVPQLTRQLIRIDNGTVRGQRDGMAELIDALDKEQALIVFPAIRQAGFVITRQRDRKWHHRFLKLALYSKAPILPVHIKSKARKVPVFTASVPKVLRLDPRHNLHFSIGEPIAYETLKRGPLTVEKRSQLVRRHLFNVAKGRPGIFATEKSIIHPQSPAALRAELRQAPLLGETADGQRIHLVDYQNESAVMREIGRLREYTFRHVGEGTGRIKDLDRYDRDYKHLVLWNDQQLEIVGSYRLAIAAQVLERHGLAGLYCQTLFELGNGFERFLPEAIELGRSFVQPKYWGKRSLDYLWYGIGAYLKHHPGIRYLYGPVSISNAYPEPARQALVAFYRKHFGTAQCTAFARRPYNIETGPGGFFLSTDHFSNHEEEFGRLKTYLDYFGVKVPTLYKQYTDVCEPGGVVFEDFSVDPGFANCIDGLVRVDLQRLKPKKRQRYIG